MTYPEFGTRKNAWPRDGEQQAWIDYHTGDLRARLDVLEIPRKPLWRRVYHAVLDWRGRRAARRAQRRQDRMERAARVIREKYAKAGYFHRSEFDELETRIADYQRSISFWRHAVNENADTITLQKAVIKRECENRDVYKSRWLMVEAERNAAWAALAASKSRRKRRGTGRNRS